MLLGRWSWIKKILIRWPSTLIKPKVTLHHLHTHPSFFFFFTITPPNFTGVEETPCQDKPEPERLIDPKSPDGRVDFVIEKLLLRLRIFKLFKIYDKGFGSEADIDLFKSWTAVCYIVLALTSSACALALTSISSYATTILDWSVLAFGWSEWIVLYAFVSRLDQTRFGSFFALAHNVTELFMVCMCMTWTNLYGFHLPI